MKWQREKSENLCFMAQNVALTQQQNQLVALPNGTFAVTPQEVDKPAQCKYAEQIVLFKCC